MEPRPRSFRACEGVAVEAIGAELAAARIVFRHEQFEAALLVPSTYREDVCRELDLR